MGLALIPTLLRVFHFHSLAGRKNRGGKAALNNASLRPARVLTLAHARAFQISLCWLSRPTKKKKSVRVDFARAADYFFFFFFFREGRMMNDRGCFWCCAGYESTAPVAAIMGPRQQTVAAGSTITLKCLINSPYQTRPIKGVQWFRDNKLLTFQVTGRLWLSMGDGDIYFRGVVVPKVGHLFAAACSLKDC